MKRLHKILILLTVLVTVLYSCSTQKDTLVSKNFHALTAKYNVLFNGEQAFQQGLKDIREQHTDNFWKRLQIEPITFDERKIEAPKFNSPGEDFNNKQEENKSATPFDRAEEKAVKAIQKHSMNIKGYEKNRQIDDAYLLLGKSRYYTQRFIPAVEAFNYIIANYPNANLNYETRVWRAKANVRLGNEETAIQSMKLLLKVVDEKEEISKEVQEQAYTAMAMAYTETDTIQKVIEHLNNATQTFINREQSARNMFILGQVYSELNRKDSARMVFQKLANKKQAPVKYRIHANIELVKNSAKDSSDVLLINRFKKLIKNTDNRKYYDELYYQLGTLYEDRGNTKKAVEYYKKSLTAKDGSNYQKTYTYERLGNLHFNKQDYLLAGSYYDSVLQITSKEFDSEKRIRRIRRKNKGLTTLKKYEDVVKNNDSILQLVAMSTNERTAYFESYIEKIKKEDEERRQQLLNSQNFGNQFGGGTSFGNNKGKWYFYNTQSKGFGEAEFQRIWGTRPLEDNWRLSDKTAINSNNEIAEEEDINKSRYELATYIEAIPTDPKILNQLKEDRNDALYQLGLIYKEQFKNTGLAIKNFERLTNLNQKEELKLPLNYHLYQLYTEVGEIAKATRAKEFILQNYPNTRFAEIIISPDKKLEAIEEKEDEIAKKYKELYYLYKNYKYEEVVNQINTFSETVAKSDLIPKLALLKALAIGKYKSKEEYKKALEFVAFSYANKEEGKKAEEIIKLLK
ncbi:protein involved in gliding motility SprE [Tenacibaculum adriaticum]|uniref:Protein involved in gliding motility SprE n=1 Tax=Tenacibaculum adriaticum TaxID=413713 RepID=A0A5S5DV63_9FLAO|nr:tetratricopeptide repeat protein [Tenacibaculum adriaticum]TYP99741.1 protein involved in gliding motility SprE [Tenacibaculum adriaticum]